ncbi:hypothetical protein [Parabacteroides pacaensis]|nr:hypothetical protein [Parabacteroides pacaensis]
MRKRNSCHNGLPNPVMADNDPPSPIDKAAFCLSEIPRQARDDRVGR